MAVKEREANNFHIGTGQAVTVNRLFESLARILTYDQQPIYNPACPGDILHSYADSSLARDVLNWNPQISFQEGLRMLVESVEQIFGP